MTHQKSGTPSFLKNKQKHVQNLQKIHLCMLLCFVCVLDIVTLILGYCVEHGIERQERVWIQVQNNFKRHT